MFIFNDDYCMYACTAFVRWHRFGCHICLHRSRVKLDYWIAYTMRMVLRRDIEQILLLTSIVLKQDFLLVLF